MEHKLIEVIYTEEQKEKMKKNEQTLAGTSTYS